MGSSGGRSGAQHIEVIGRGLWRVGRWTLFCSNRDRGVWFLPGGHVDPGEHATDAVIRELLEETGLEGFGIGEVLLVDEHVFDQDGRARHEYTLTFHVEHPLWVDGGGGGEPKPVPAAEEHLRFRWISDGELAAMEIVPAATRAYVMRLADEVRGRAQDDVGDRPLWATSRKRD